MHPLAPTKFGIAILFVCLFVKAQRDPPPRPQQRSLTLPRFGILRAYATLLEPPRSLWAGSCDSPVYSIYSLTYLYNTTAESCTAASAVRSVQKRQPELPQQSARAAGATSEVHRLVCTSSASQQTYVVHMPHAAHGLAVGPSRPGLATWRCSHLVDAFSHSTPHVLHLCCPQPAALLTLRVLHV